MKSITTDMTAEAQVVANQSIQIKGNDLLLKGFELVFAMGVQYGFEQAVEGLDALGVPK